MNHSAPIRVGGFVLLPGTHGVGRLEGVSAGQAVVSLFHSFIEKEEVRLPADQLVRAFLPPETRAYLTPEEKAPRIGRITNFSLSESGYVDYEIQFPNRRVGYFSETEIQVRCWRARGNQAEVLAAGIGEAQFLHDRRSAATQKLVESRSSAQGMTGLISSGIEFVPHQISAVRRILSDPNLRYLIADEVGLGKTVEAGVIIRQILIDEPNRRICILVPRVLVSQWRSELQLKFYIDEFPGRVNVIAYDELNNISSMPDLLVIDEAHHIVGDQLASYLTEKIKVLARKVPRLLLLSATPALANPEKFLSLLSLLDPSSYCLNDLESFKIKLAQRQEFGRLLLGLTPDSPSIVLRRRVAEAKHLFPDDPDIDELTNRLDEAIREGSNDIPKFTAELSQHIAETYRVNQRVIRARRSDAAGWEFQPRGPRVRVGENVGFSHVRIDDDEDRRIQDLVNAVEEWRSAARFAFEGASEKDRLRAAFRYRELVEALGVSVEAFVETSSEGETLFQGEDEIRAGIRAIFASEPGARSKLDVVQDSLHLLKGQVAPHTTAKIVAFCSSTDMAQALHEVMSRPDKDSACLIVQGLLSGQTESVLKKFSLSSKAWLLIVDRSGEEGLNLSFVDAIVHVDLPLSAPRIEQRIGRVDRFGRRKDCIRQRIFLPYTDEGSVWLAWEKVLEEGFRVFHEPISDIQFLLEELDREFALAVFDRGSIGAQDFLDRLPERIRSERRSQDEQYALDRIALIGESAISFIDAIESFEETESEFGEAMESWLVGALMLSRHQPPSQASKAFCLAWGKGTLLPRHPWEQEFGLSNPRPMTWFRRIATTHPGVALGRPGSLLLDACQRFMRWDDRGATFITLRKDATCPKGSPPWLAFKLCFLVEPDMPQASEIFPEADDMSGMRRAEYFLPPTLYTIYLDIDGVPITEPSQLRLLERPYCKDRNEEGGDINLGSRPELLKQFIDPAVLQKICIQVSEKGREAILRRDDVACQLEKAARLAGQDTDRRRRRLLRRAAFDGVEVSQELRINDKVELAVTKPKVRLDAIGLFVVSSENYLVGQSP